MTPIGWVLAEGRVGTACAIAPRMPPSSATGPRRRSRSQSPHWRRLYERCRELGVVGIEHERPTIAELRRALADRA